jgi:peptidoglycan hydrolase CwlO-like protein
MTERILVLVLVLTVIVSSAILLRFMTETHNQIKSNQIKYTSWNVLVVQEQEQRLDDSIRG